MSDKQLSGDISVFSLFASSMLAVLKNVSYSLDFDTADGSTVKQLGKVGQVLKRGGTISTTLYTTISDGLRVAALDATVLTVGGVDHFANLKSLRFNGEFETRNTEGAADAWRYPQVVKKDYRAEVELFLPAAGVGLSVEAHSSDRTDVQLVLSFTLNGVAITLPMIATKFEHVFNNGEEQLYRFTLMGKAPDNLATAYPTAPTGTTTLLEKALNAPQTAIAFALTSHATEGVAYAGNAIITAFSFTIEDGQVVENDYTFATQGTITATAN